MHAVVEAMVVLLAGGVGVVGGGSALLVRRLHRANRVSAERATSAPTTWLWSLRRSAVLHRRLRGVCQVAWQVGGAPPAGRRLLRRRRSEPASPLSRLAQGVVDQAVLLDGRLVAADRLSGMWKRQALAAVETEIQRLEASAARLRGLALSWHDRVQSPALRSPDLQEQLDAVEAALGELSAGA